MSRSIDRPARPEGLPVAALRPVGRFRRLWRDTGPRAAVLVLGIAAASYMACLHMHREAEARDLDRYAMLHREAGEDARARLEAYRGGLLGLAGLFAADQVVTAEAFRRAVLAMEPAINFPAATGLGYIRRVPHGAEPGFIETVLEHGAEGFALRPLPEGGSGPDRVVVTYVEPRERNAAALGLDIGTDPVRRATAEEAAATGEMALSPPLTLVQAADRGPGLLAMMAVESATGDPQRRSETGWVYAALLPRELFAGLGEGPLAEISATLVATGSPGTSGKPVVLGGRVGVANGGDPLADGGNLLHARTSLAVGGQRWTLATRATEHFQHASLLGAWLVKAAGLLAAGLTLALFRVPAIERRRGRREARRLAAQMTCDLREAAETDELTGLMNRAAIMEAVEGEVDASRLRIGRHHALLFLDFDRFKEVNDTRGHAAGDELLRRISGRILAELRSGDSAGLARRAGRRVSDAVRVRRREAEDAARGSAVPARCKDASPARRGDAVPARRGDAIPARRGDAIPARLGGDEFVVLLRDLKQPGDAEEVARRLLARLSRPYRLSGGGEPVTSTPSIGIAIGGPALADGASLFAAADAAMYEAKRAGRACIRVHDPDAEPPGLRLAA